MADIKITEYTELTAPIETDVMEIVDDPTGTPISKKVQVSSLLNAKTMYSIVPAADFALAAATGVQAALPAAQDTFTVEAGKTYMLEAILYISKSGTTCTTALAWALGGGASITSMKLAIVAANLAANTTGATGAFTFQDQIASTVVNATASGGVMIKVKGLIRFNAGGTLTPQVNFSATPTSPVMLANSFVKLTAMESNVTNTLGNVA